MHCPSTINRHTNTPSHFYPSEIFGRTCRGQYPTIINTLEQNIHQLTVFLLLFMMYTSGGLVLNNLSTHYTAMIYAAHLSSARSTMPPANQSFRSFRSIPFSSIILRFDGIPSRPTSSDGMPG